MTDHVTRLEKAFLIRKREIYLYFLKTSCLLIFLIIFTVPADASAQAATTGAPEIVIQQTIYDAGIAKPGDKVVGTFLVENHGDSTLLIKRVAPT
ncbi:hypothetical protein JXJ21_01670 [candidate division KSB1 bacterium]|nr:hypothetical protein [candidate division KSB1 bacterium]